MIETTLLPQITDDERGSGTSEPRMKETEQLAVVPTFQRALEPERIALRGGIDRPGMVGRSLCARTARNAGPGQSSQPAQSGPARRVRTPRLMI